MRLTLSLCTAFMLAAALPAAAFPDGGPVTADNLAILQYLMDHCVPLVPDAETRLKEYMTHYIENTSRREVDELRATSAYRDAYAKATAEFAEQPKSDATTNCRAVIGVLEAQLIPKPEKPDKPESVAPAPKG